MTDLIARIESADGPDREIDAELMAIAHDWKIRALSKGSHYRDWCWVNRETGKWVTTSRQGYTFTASIDAALTLVPEKCLWRMYHDTMGRDGSYANAYVLTHRVGNEKEASGIGITPALALAAAALKARGV